MKTDNKIYVYRLMFHPSFVYGINDVKYEAHLDKSDNSITWIENCIENDVKRVELNTTSFKPFLGDDTYLLFKYQNKPYILHY